MGFAQTIVGGLTVALFMGLPVFWYKDQALFHPIARALLIVLAAVLTCCAVFTVAYTMGASTAHYRDQEVISDIRHKFWEVRGQEIKQGAEPTANEATIMQAVPVTLDSLSINDTLFVIPLWLWGCGLLLLTELAVLTNVHYSRGSPIVSAPDR